MSSHIITPLRALARLPRLAGGLVRRAVAAATPFPRPPAPPRPALLMTPQAHYCPCGLPVPDKDWRCTDGCKNG